MPYSGYLYSTIVNHRETVKRIVNDIRKDNFDAIVVTGLSGVLIGPVVAYLLKKPLMVVRKAGDSVHKSYDVESSIPSDAKFTYIIIDDCRSSGSTIKRIQEFMLKDHPLSKWVGTYLYAGSGRWYARSVSSETVVVK